MIGRRTRNGSARKAPARAAHVLKQPLGALSILCLLLMGGCGGMATEDLLMIMSGTGALAAPGILPPGAGVVRNAFRGRGSATGRVVGESCESDDSRKLCLGVQYVAFQDEDGDPVVTEDEAVANVQVMNRLFGKCDIGFQIERYRQVKAADHGLRHNIGNYSELDDVREAFADEKLLLIATTGKWDRAGSLGNTGANAWTALPGAGPYGAVLESTVATFGNIVAHEIGHYLNLLHVSDSQDLMNPIIYSRSTTLYSSQCARARAAAESSWEPMLR